MTSGDQQSPRTSRKILAAFGVLAILAAAGSAIRLFSKGDLGDVFRRDATPDQLARALAAEPGLEEMMATFRSLYPAEYDGLLRSLSDTVNSQGQQAASREAFMYMRRFITSKVGAITSAPTADLQRLGNALLEVHQALRRSSVPICAQFVMRGFSPGQQPPREAMEALGRANVAQLQAAKNGEGAGRVERGSLKESDATAWFQRLQAIDPASAALVDSNRIDGADPQAQCNVGVSIYQAAVDLPPEQSANVTAEFIRESMRSLN